MKVVFGNLLFGFLLHGGAEVQLAQTRDALQQLGVKVELFSPWDTGALSDADILHWFHVDPSSVQLFHISKRKGLKIVVSAIFWPLKNEWLQATWTKVSSLPRRLGIPLTSYAAMQREALKLADAVVVSSQTESNKISKIFGISKTKQYIVPVGVSKSFLGASKEMFVAKYRLEDFILCVGRVEHRKNQLGLLLATKDLGFPVVIIGDYSVDPDYYQSCLKVKHPNVYFLGRIEHNDPILKSAYAAARVLAMPSTLETPGLVGLEGALAGARLVVTKYGNTREYFMDYAEYVDPYSIKSIRAGVLRALEAPDSRVEKLRQLILDNFTWENSARKLYQLYQRLVEKSNLVSEI